MNVLGVVLAGGKSSRMGTDKCLLELKGKTLLDRSKALLRDSGVDNLVVSTNKTGLGNVQDIYPDQGPIGGIHAVCHAFPRWDLLCIPVDMPLLDILHLRQLCNIGQSERCNVHFENHFMPLYLHNTPALRLYLEKTLSHGHDRSIRSLCNHLPTVRTSSPDHNLLLNTNTLRQWRQVISSTQTSESFYESSK